MKGYSPWGHKESDANENHILWMIYQDYSAIKPERNNHSFFLLRRQFIDDYSIKRRISMMFLSGAMFFSVSVCVCVCVCVCVRARVRTHARL